MIPRKIHYCWFGRGPMPDLVNKCIEKGMLVLSAGGNVLRLLPPLVIGKGDVDKAISIIEEVLKEI